MTALVGRFAEKRAFRAETIAFRRLNELACLRLRKAERWLSLLRFRVGMTSCVKSSDAF